MAKKIVLETRSEPTFFTFVGISCHLIDYRFIYELNKQLDFNFVKEKDFPGLSTNSDKSSSFSFYHYYDEDQRLAYFLLSNRGLDGLLFPGLKESDFILVIEGVFRNPKKETFLTSLRQVPKILMAYEIKHTSLKNTESFLMDLELHVLQVNKVLKRENQTAF